MTSRLGWIYIQPHLSNGGLSRLSTLALASVSIATSDCDDLG